ncbi:hypothetical protein BC834DRAFT_426122 [Gloeopeniophorella convolvens]|nr:hypothetical protein BC834DRAFT_426122 [Gloeopeniophorella convolvens]
MAVQRYPATSRPDDQHDLLGPIATSDQSEVRVFVQRFKSKNFGLCDLMANGIVSSAAIPGPLGEFDGILSAKRLCQPDEFSECFKHRCITDDAYKSFFSDDPDELPDAPHTTTGEMVHYTHIWQSPQLLLLDNYLEKKEAQVRNLLQDFLVGFEENDSGEIGCAHGL